MRVGDSGTRDKRLIQAELAGKTDAGHLKWHIGGLQLSKVEI
jgi:hypothetical protein